MSATLFTTAIVNGRRFMTVETLTPKIRRQWTMKPTTRVAPNKKHYSRKSRLTFDID
jgi:hypothetical protein